MSNIAGADERRLIRDIMKGNRMAMQELYNLTVRNMNAVCSRYVVDPDDVKDVLQESYLKAFSRIKTFMPRDNGSLVAWLRRIVVNEALQLLRRKKLLNQLVSLDDVEDEPEDFTVSDQVTDYVSSIDIGDLMELVQQLPDGYRTIFNLYAIEKLPHSKIATMLGISEGTSASQYHRARKQLAQLILDHQNKKL
ncbi:MAG: RNA polymerase sigma factor [Muribaculaceae bacterium]|nr:RNA polymerase sigma factor [Muribaculaceae bacterium]MBR0025431.1 RNA polymerase sigma factor [Muribaculaceae bacterium]